MEAWQWWGLAYLTFGWGITEVSLMAAVKYHNYDKMPYSTASRIMTYFLSIFFWPLLVISVIFRSNKK